MKTVIYVSCMQIKTSRRAIFPAQSRGLTLSNGNTTTREINRVLVYPLERLRGGGGGGNSSGSS